MTDAEILQIIADRDVAALDRLAAAADAVRQTHYGKRVFFRGLIEFTNYCKNDCYYCGLRHGNLTLLRYRLTPDEILECCRQGQKLGYSTYVLQGGEDPYFTDERVVEIVAAIRAEFPDCAITLSLGEKSAESYEKFFRAGANRYLLRHETASAEHYQKLHPSAMSLATRMQCLRDLRKIGYAVGAGFMVGTPWQTPANLLEDLRFIEEFQPEMVGIGPFLPQTSTPFGNCLPGDLTLTLKMVALARLLVPKALMPATTALGTLSAQGRELGLKHGANVVMPNLSPTATRQFYALYDNKICTGDEAAHCRRCIENRIVGAGFTVDMGRGDPAR
ncbi:[FeFe] hydrogenase H-cluster radical SAM maturase HydE [Planctomycetales bacterium]|nr:[FeFe] hydrogenase H-cluster radical SAM maturase HydE [Planctomycetales bacterium]GHT07207.1 [FeFe] hydrogenase H-cluster radical SAM maturase HydE [Planctomycetales bacterium]